MKSVVVNGHGNVLGWNLCSVPQLGMRLAKVLVRIILTAADSIVAYSRFRMLT